MAESNNSAGLPIIALPTTGEPAPSTKPIPEQQQQLEIKLKEILSGSFIALPPHAWRAFGLTIEVPRDKAFSLFQQLKNNPAFSFNMLVDLTCVDWLDRKEPRFEVVYQLMSLTHLHRLCVKVLAPEEDPSVDSVRPIWDSANFLEREVWDMYGVVFKGHGDLRRIMMYDEFVGHPLRKDYPIRGKQPRVPLRIPELRNTSQDMQKEQLVSLPVRPGTGKREPVGRAQ